MPAETNICPAWAIAISKPITPARLCMPAGGRFIAVLPQLNNFPVFNTRHSHFLSARTGIATGRRPAATARTAAVPARGTTATARSGHVRAWGPNASARNTNVSAHSAGATARKAHVSTRTNAYNAHAPPATARHCAAGS